ncbi:acetolactate synthase small subunit [Helicobacter sp. 23-1048]
MECKKTICVTVINEHSVLARVSGLFAGRGYNIESLSVAPVPNSELSYITITTNGNLKVFEQIVKQLHKLIPVLSVVESEQVLQREMALVKIPTKQPLSEIEALARAYNGIIAEVNEKYIIISANDTPERIDSFLKAVEIFKPKEMIRSGAVAIERT